ncbi:MAG: hypothetical protein ABI669_07715 [Usitatibacter sp.]
MPQGRQTSRRLQLPQRVFTAETRAAPTLDSTSRLTGAFRGGTWFGMALREAALTVCVRVEFMGCIVRSRVPGAHRRRMIAASAQSPENA